MKFSTQAGIIADGGTHGFIRIYRETLRCLIQRWKIEQQLRAAGEKGAEICVFGDIDLEPHRQWCTARCTAVGMEACFPLWQENRKALVLEFLDTGYRTLITTVDTSRMDASFLGRGSMQSCRCFRQWKKQCVANRCFSVVYCVGVSTGRSAVRWPMIARIRTSYELEDLS